MSYTPPLGGAVDASWVGAASYTPPLGGAVDAAWFTAVVGTGLGKLPLSGAGVAAHGQVITGEGFGALPLSGAGAARHGVRGAGAGSLRLGGAGLALHPRYELRGEVRLGGVLVNRRVRGYLRSSGALLGQADTVAGKFQVHAGFAEAECYVTPIDLDPDATDWLPPTANRVLSVLAEDAP
jgi:hypothetical protein